MAEIENYVPKLIRIEVGVARNEVKYESLEDYFTRSKKYNYIVTNGTYIVKGDRGAMTVVGVSIKCWKNYLKSVGRYKGPNEAVRSLAQISYKEWLDVLKRVFWNPCKATSMSHQQTAEMLVDFAYNCGVARAVKKAQLACGVAADGIIGPKTLEAFNAPGAYEKIRQARVDYYNNLVALDPGQKKFLKGWLNRLDRLEK